MNNLFENFDLLGYLDSKGIEYREEGKNVTEGWVNINCLWCEDPSFHLGITFDDLSAYPEGGFHCWRCGEAGTGMQLLQLLEGGASRIEVNTIVMEFQLGVEREKKIKKKSKFFLPPEAGSLSSIHRKYLKQRRYDPDYIVEKYRVLGTRNLGNDKFRLIIPIIVDGKVVNYTGRDISGKQESKYKNCPNDKAIILVKDCLYNIDNVKAGTLVVVEGVFDVWRIGDGAVGTLGTEVTPAQTSLLVQVIREKMIEKVAIIFDSEDNAQVKAVWLGEYEHWLPDAG